MGRRCVTRASYFITFLLLIDHKSIKRTRILDDILKEKEIKIEREKNLDQDAGC